MAITEIPLKNVKVIRYIVSMDYKKSVYLDICNQAAKINA